MQKTKLKLPFKGEWFVFWGGDTKELNHHHEIPAQKYALDFVMTNKGGKTHKGGGSTNEDYFCFGQKILSPADGEVVEAVDGVRDNAPGETNNYMKTGNYALIRHASEEYSFIAHLRQGSLNVRAGNKVKSGQKIGKCGNSGNSSEPHLHYHLQNSFIFSRFDKKWNTQAVAKGIRVTFENIEANNAAKKSYAPIKGDKVLQL